MAANTGHRTCAVIQEPWPIQQHAVRYVVKERRVLGVHLGPTRPECAGVLCNAGACLCVCGLTSRVPANRSLRIQRHISVTQVHEHLQGSEGSTRCDWSFSGATKQANLLQIRIHPWACMQAKRDLSARVSNQVTRMCWAARNTRRLRGACHSPNPQGATQLCW